MSDRWVYLIRDNSDGLIKIGYSRNPVKRMAKLQYLKGGRLEILRTFAGDSQDERALHEYFSEFRVEGEWFRPAPELLRLAQNNTNAEDMYGEITDSWRTRCTKPISNKHAIGGMHYMLANIGVPEHAARLIEMEAEIEGASTMTAHIRAILVEYAEDNASSIVARYERSRAIVQGGKEEADNDAQ